MKKSTVLFDRMKTRDNDGVKSVMILGQTLPLIIYLLYTYYLMHSDMILQLQNDLPRELSGYKSQHLANLIWLSTLR